MSFRPVLPLLILGFLAAGCTGQSERFNYTRPLDRPREEVVKATLDVLENDDWRLEKADLEKGEFESKWKETLHHFRYEGYRTKAYATVEKEENSPGYKVGMKVKKERNDAIQDPANPDTAEWSSVGFDEDRENILLYAVLAKLEPLDLEKDYERRLEEREEMFKEVDTYFEKKKTNPGTVRPPDFRPRPAEGGTEQP